MTNPWREARRAGHRAALREVAEALGGDTEAYTIAGFLARHNRSTEGGILTVERLRELEDPEDVTGIGEGRARRIQEWRQRQLDSRG